MNSDFDTETRTPEADSEAIGMVEDQEMLDVERDDDGDYEPDEDYDPSQGAIDDTRYA